MRHLRPKPFQPSLSEVHPQLALDLTDLKDVRPSWEMRPVTASAVDVRSSTYVVKTGDTLRGIGEATGAGSDAIARANALAVPYVLRPGQSLTIPGGRYHRVREGETGIAISRAYGLVWRSIVEANALTEPFTLRVGQRLLLPGTTATASPPTSLESRAAAFQIGIDDVVTGSEPAQTTDATPLPKPVMTTATAPARSSGP